MKDENLALLNLLYKRLLSGKTIEPESKYEQMIKDRIDKIHKDKLDEIKGKANKIEEQIKRLENA